jgi:hypothetical protein
MNNCFGDFLLIDMIWHRTMKCYVLMSEPEKNFSFVRQVNPGCLMKFVPNSVRGMLHVVLR